MRRIKPRMKSKATFLFFGLKLVFSLWLYYTFTHSESSLCFSLLDSCGFFIPSFVLKEILELWNLYIGETYELLTTGRFLFLRVTFKTRRAYVFYVPELLNEYHDGSQNIQTEHTCTTCSAAQKSTRYLLQS